MDTVGLVYAIVAGAAVLALWSYVRLGPRRPRSRVAMCVHVVAAVAGLALGPNAVGWIVADSDSTRLVALALFGVFLPTMTYVFVAALFVLERVQQSLSMR